MRDGRDQQALDVLATAHKRSQPDAKIEYLEGMVLAHLGRRDEAVAALKESIRLDAAVAEPHYELGRLLFEGGSLEPAKVELGRAAALAPDHANAFYQLSRIYGRWATRRSLQRWRSRPSDCWRSRERRRWKNSERS